MIARMRRLALRLYIAGPGVYATTAQQNIRRFALAAGIEYDLEVVDLLRHPEHAAKDAVVVTPTLVKLSPSPRTMIIGDLGDFHRMAAALGATLP